MPTITADSSVFTFQDAIERLLAYTNQNGSQANVSNVKQAVLDAYEDIVIDRNWRYLARTYRYERHADVTGTCSYSSSTGEFTIDTGSWPTWAERAIIEIDNVRHLIKTRSSSTVLVADPTLRPLDDIATGASFTLYDCINPLPTDFRRTKRPLDEQIDSAQEYVDFASWYESIRFRHGSEYPGVFAIGGDPYEPGRMALLVNPIAGADRTIDLPYHRYPRPLTYDGSADFCRAGTISASASASVTGSSTTFEAGMVGALLRFGRTTSSYPTGRSGANPFKQQVYVSGYSSATAITLHEAITISGGKYTISDPIDLDRSLLDAFWLGCRYKLASALGMASLNAAKRDYEEAFAKARGADSKSTQPRSAWGSPGNAYPLVRNAIQQVPQSDE